MKTYIKFLFVLFVIPMILTTGCKEEATDQYVVLKDHLIDIEMDLPTVVTGWITTAQAVIDSATFEIPGYYVLDIRSEADYNTGHIKGAVNTPLADVLVAAENAGGKPILVVCKTGQTAGHAVVGLRLSGYADAKVLKWGMASWNADFAGPWTGNSGIENGAKGEGHANWTAAPGAITADATFEAPVVETLETEGAEILKEQVENMLSVFNSISNTEVLTNPGNYFINNFWTIEDVEHYGHIKGARRIKPMSLVDGGFEKLDPDATVVTYCWTGQTSSMVTAYLKVLGYDSKSLLFGTNGMIYPSLGSHKYTSAATFDYE